jgi:hypothetical protein
MEEKFAMPEILNTKIASYSISALQGIYKKE